MDINNFVVRITEENKSIIREWWEKEFPSYTNKAWSVDAHYGKEGGMAYSLTNGMFPTPIIISFEEFEQNILNKQPIYNIY